MANINYVLRRQTDVSSDVMWGRRERAWGRRGSADTLRGSFLQALVLKGKKKIHERLFLILGF